MAGFQKGNKLGHGRPRIALNKPELLLPIIFQKSRINWAEDFAKLYKIKKLRRFTLEEKETFVTLLALMPYLCTKVAVKDLDFSKWHDEKDKAIMDKQTQELIKALENDGKPNQDSGQSGVEGGNPPLPA